MNREFLTERHYLDEDRLQPVSLVECASFNKNARGIILWIRIGFGNNIEQEKSLLTHEVLVEW